MPIERLPVSRRVGMVHSPVMLPFPVSLLPDALQDDRVFRAMETIPRHAFLPDRVKQYADFDVALSIGHGQTISQPFIVAYMTAGLAIPQGGRVLEIGTGSGYQTAILAEMGATVFSIELISELADGAKEKLRHLRLLERVEIRVGDGRHGWASKAPFDGLLCAAATKTIPPAFIEQVAVGGRIVLPVGPPSEQVLRVLERRADSLFEIGSEPVRFVPLVGQSGDLEG